MYKYYIGSDMVLIKLKHKYYFSNVAIMQYNFNALYKQIIKQVYTLDIS